MPLFLETPKYTSNPCVHLWWCMAPKWYEKKKIKPATGQRIKDKRYTHETHHLGLPVGLPHFVPEPVGFFWQRIFGNVGGQLALCLKSFPNQMSSYQRQSTNFFGGSRGNSWNQMTYSSTNTTPLVRCCILTSPKNPKSDHTSITWQSLGKNQFLYIDSTQAMTFLPNWEDPPSSVACLKLWPLAPQTPASIKALTVAVLQQNSCQKKLIAVGVFFVCFVFFSPG